MEIVTKNLIDYLTRRGLVDRKCVVDGGLAVSMSRSRNRFLRVTRRSGPGYFIKQALESEPMTAETVRREAEIYRGAFADDRLASLRSLLPRFHAFDEDQHMLIIDLVDDAENLAEHHRRSGGCHAELAVRIGEAIAGYHQIRFEPDKPQPTLFAQRPPWIFDLHTAPDVSHLRRNAASSVVTDLVLQRPELAVELAALRSSWARDTLIHTDMKWENCLLTPRTAPLAEQRLLVIDWELADIGDPAWDVGGMLQAYLTYWIHSIPVDRSGTPDELVARAQCPLTAVQPAIAAFWSAYVRGRAGYTTVPPEFLVRCVRMMAARMLVTAYEMAAHAAGGDPRILLILQIAFNVFESPESAARHLLGLLDSDRGAPVPAAGAGCTPSPMSASAAPKIRSQRHG